MRQEVFDMEQDVLEIGDIVEITEGVLPRSFFYTAEPAAAMSRNYKENERILSTEGKIIAKEKIGTSYLITIEFDE